MSGRGRNTAGAHALAPTPRVRVAVAVLCFLLLHLLVWVASPPRLWGVDALAYLPPRVGYAFLVGAPGVLLFTWWLLRRPQLASWLAEAARPVGSRRRWLVVGGVLIAGGVLFWWLRSALPLLGDGTLYLHELDGGDWSVAQRTDRAPLAFWLVRTIHALFVPVGGSAVTAYRAFSILSGLCFLALALWAARRFARNRAEALVLVLLLLGQGYLQMFFGYVENYAVLLTGTALYLFLGMSAARGNGSLWPAAATLVVLFPTHLLSAALVPSLAVLTLQRIRSDARPGWRAKLRLSAPLIAVLVGGPALALLLGADVAALSGGLRHANFLPLFGPPGFMQPYRLFSAAHLRDILNQQLLAAPAAVMALVLVRRHSRRPGNTTSPFLLAATAFPLLSAWVLNPEIGAFRDWDTFAFTGLPFTLWAATVLIGWLRDRPRALPVLACIPVAAALHTGLWIWVNAHEAPSLDRFQTQLEGGALSRHARAYGWETVGTHYRDAGRADQAVAALRKAIQAGPENPRYRVFLGNMLFSAGAYERAIGQYHEAVRLGWGRESLAQPIGNANYRLGRFGQAAASYLSALKEQPEDPGLWGNLGSARFSMGRTEEAVAAYRQAAALAPGNPNYLYSLGCALIRQEKPGEALESLRAAMARGMDTPEVHFDAGNALYAMQRYREAIREYDAAVQLRPSYLGAIQNLGASCLATGDCERAVREFEKAVSIDPGNAGIWLNLATAYRSLGRAEDAREALRRAIAIDPNHPLAARARQLLGSTP